MPGSVKKKDKWLDTVIDQLRALDGVVYGDEIDSHIGVSISRKGETKELSVAISDTDYRAQKIQYSHLRALLTELGVEEGQTFVAAKLPRRPMTPQMRAAREKQKIDFDAWQELWRTLRKAEKALDVDYEINQMRDYY